jgi:signal transduction histidine kinase
MPTDQQLLTIVEDLEALDSIYQCGLTQERISNDVLSLGKIQLDMLRELTTPLLGDHELTSAEMFDVQTDLYAEAQKLISVFQNEARMKGVSLSFKLSCAFKRLGLRGVMTDPLRLGQV